jgi:hypothetical protein
VARYTKQVLDVQQPREHWYEKVNKCQDPEFVARGMHMPRVTVCGDFVQCNHDVGLKRSQIDQTPPVPNKPKRASVPEVDSGGSPHHNLKPVTILLLPKR